MQFVIEIKEAKKMMRKKQMSRLFAYYYLFRDATEEKMSNVYETDRKGVFFWWKKMRSWESKGEKSLYRRMNNWKENHPISAIILCTVLGVIVLNLLTGVFVEAAIRFLLDN